MYDNVERMKTFKRKLKSRIKTLLIPYLVWNVIWMLFRVFITYIPIIANNIESLEMFEPSVKNVLSGVFLYKYNGVCWYLFFLMLYEIFSPLLFHILKRKFSALILIIVSFWISGNAFPGLGHISHFNSFFFYCFGAFLALYGFKIVNQRYTKKAIFLAGSLFLFVTITFNLIYINEYVDELLRLVYVGSLWIFAECFTQLKIYWWMEISFFIYLFHGFPQQCINKIFSFLLPHTEDLAPFSVIVNTVGGVAITIILGILIALVLLKICRPIWLILSGYRVPKLSPFSEKN